MPANVAPGVHKRRCPAARQITKKTTGLKFTYLPPEYSGLPFCLQLTPTTYNTQHADTPLRPAPSLRTCLQPRTLTLPSPPHSLTSPPSNTRPFFHFHFRLSSPPLSPSHLPSLPAVPPLKKLLYLHFRPVPFLPPQHPHNKRGAVSRTPVSNPPVLPAFFASAPSTTH